MVTKWSPRRLNRPVPEFSPDSTIREVVEEVASGRQLLYEHGYDLGAGFVDTLSQFQTLEQAFRNGRLRDLGPLLEELNNR